MELYDGMIQKTREYLSADTPRNYLYDERKCWGETTSGEMIMLRDAAFELGGGSCESVNYTCVTSNQELVKENGIFLYGPELRELREDTSFARIVFLNVKEDALDEAAGDDAAYRFIRELEYVRYHIFPKGYMVRTSAKNSREQARVSRDAIKAGISFERLGESYIRKYLENPKVRKVQVIFLVGKEKLQPFVEEAVKADTVTEALNHILKGMPMNCGSCDLQVICNEVEGMRALHQGNRNR